MVVIAVTFNSRLQILMSQRSWLGVLVDILTICIDKSGRIMGWMYGREWVGHEAKFLLVN